MHFIIYLFTSIYMYLHACYISSPIPIPSLQHSSASVEKSIRHPHPLSTPSNTTRISWSICDNHRIQIAPCETWYDNYECCENSASHHTWSNESRCDTWNTWLHSMCVLMNTWTSSNKMPANFSTWTSYKCPDIFFLFPSLARYHADASHSKHIRIDANHNKYTRANRKCESTTF